jgi:hypothetical protein
MYAEPAALLSMWVSRTAADTTDQQDTGKGTRVIGSVFRDDAQAITAVETLSRNTWDNVMRTDRLYMVALTAHTLLVAVFDSWRVGQGAYISV